MNQSLILVCSDFFDGLHQSQREVSLMGVIETLICGCKVRYLECYYKFCLFSKGVVVGFSAISMTSLVPGSWPDFQKSFDIDLECIKIE